MDTSRKGKVYSQTMIAIPLDTKCKAQTLGIKLSRAGLAGIEAEILIAEAKQRKESLYTESDPDVKV